MICIVLALSGCGTSSTQGSSTSRQGDSPDASTLGHLARAAQPFRLFADSSIWNRPASSAGAEDPASGLLVHALSIRAAEEVAHRDGPWINTTSYSVPIYTVRPSQATVTVGLLGAREPSLAAAWKSVPLPPDASPAAGTDGALVVWQPSTDKLWEFWRLVHNAGPGWQASWGGAMDHVSTDSGVYSTTAWPGAEPWWGVSASSLSIAGGLITLEDLQAGQINHALAMAVPEVRAGTYTSPAQRDDGRSTSPLSLPEGAYFRLDPTLDLVTLQLPRLTLMLAEAAQRYGIYVRDYSPVIAFFAQDPTPTGGNPYQGAAGYFEGQYPSQLLKSFPWSHLQMSKLELHAYHPKGV